MLIDSHAHLSSPSLLPRAPKIIEDALKAGIGLIINVCTDSADLTNGLQLQEQFPLYVRNIAAGTPHNVDCVGEMGFAHIAQQARARRLVAIGEIGLDYYNSTVERGLQRDFFRRYLHLALDCALPVVIHCREAFADLFEILDAEYCADPRARAGVVHCFTGTAGDAAAILQRGWSLSLSGILTFKNSTVLRAIAGEVPLERLLLETDTPYLAPQSKRGSSNEPAWMTETAHMLAQIKNISFDEVCRVTVRNTKELFSLT